MMILLLQFWRESIIAILLAIILWGYNVTIPNLKKDVIIAKQEKKVLEDVIISESDKYEKQLKELPKEIEKITTKYIRVYATIDNFVKDENETDCNASYRLLSTYNY